MEEMPVSRRYLESLTTDELIQVADKLGVDIPDGLDRIFIIEELLDTVSDDNEDSGTVPEEKDLEDSGLIESVPLPKQYNITYIEVMVRDPLWAFVFWEIKAQDKEQFEKGQDFDGYYLKVSPLENTRNDSLRNDNPGNDESDGVFKVPVTPTDSAWYIGFTPSGHENILLLSQRHYHVELCVLLKGIETVLAVSNSFRLPGLSELQSGAAKNELIISPLGNLSGYKDFHILRSSERLFRIKKDSKTNTNV